MARAGYKPAPLPAIVGGRCSKHNEKVTPSGVCMTCHHDALDAAGFDWRQIGQGTTNGGAAGWRARQQEKVS